jgi:hypothetical protein
MPGSTFVNGHALLIGVGADLPVTVKDATALRDVLVDPGRAAYPPEQVSLLTEAEASRDNVLSGLEDLIQRVEGDPDAVAMVYFSGHGGAYRWNGQTSGYFLVTHGYDSTQPEQTSVSGAEFTARLEMIHARRLLVFLDCCHAGGMPQLKEAGSTFLKAPLPPELLQSLDTGMGSVVVASSQQEESSYVGKTYSVFTECLLEALAGKGADAQDGFARVLNVLTYLFDQVPKRAPGPQHPFVKKVYDLADNFPICYYAGGHKSLPAALGVPVPQAFPRELPDFKRRGLERIRASLLEAHELQVKKIEVLIQAWKNEINPLAKFQYQQQQLEQETDLARIEREIDELDRALR